MIVVRAPMRISFVGGGTDLPAFYTESPGRVISVAINKYAYVALNQQPLTANVTVRYSAIEHVEHPRSLKNDRIREALLHLGIEKHIDIATFSDMPVKTGLGSSSSFSVALMKSLLLFLKKEVNPAELAELASHLEINLVKEPIGKQDHYAAVFGGVNIFQFNRDHSVDVFPVPLSKQKQLALEEHIQVFYTGVSRNAASVLTEQRANTKAKLEVLKKMADSVFEFRDKLLAGNFQGLGEMLHEAWMMKKTLASNVSNSVIDDLYTAGMKAGAWGGKVLGAGGGGCVMFLSPLNRRIDIEKAIIEVAKKNQLNDFAKVPVSFASSGAEILLNNGHKN